ncbi:hypothetical protein, conserved [Trypanosoma brucei gambiense DAL972]|uniref:Uncharacterized protein n=1 Tax=Trypanosoma brucei gambiense (strain MHOM/CI/86/DAL972) TaxID=679716 RepID=C9ZQD2_TRYB9|nr:hypothetical protein, conserved [Trypanosoma brucei gambiense DAL972]CBH11612.1 hypothetical protein, conserved [Trypanosoma brucei gambiense DAL972]|eukprot:XP_011773897.1 hypothetical protein, conserved [Trypanosoma brucei gambiense DAL972]
MRRCATRLLSFQQLLCGSEFVPDDAAAVQKVASAFREKYPVAPLPVPIAAGLGRSYLLQREPRRVVALLSSHPSAREVGTQLMQLLSSKNGIEAKTLLQLADALRPVSVGMCCELLCALAEKVAKTDDAREVKQMLMREIREVPHLSGTLINSLCLLSDHTLAEDRQNVVDAFNIALRKSFVSPRDYGAVLLFLARGGDHRKVLTLWLWMSHSSARWDQTAASAVIISASLTRKMNTAIDAIHCLAEANLDPTVEAQRRFIRFLAYRVPPLAAYAEQLVTHWHTPQQLWTTDARLVGVELLYTHYHAKNYEHLQGCLQVADASIEEAGRMAERSDNKESTDELRHKILRITGIPYILRHFSLDIADEPWLQNFYRSGMRMKDLGDYPLLLGVMASFARHMKEEEKFLEDIRNIKMSPENFEVTSTFIAEDKCFRNAEDTLHFVNCMGDVFSMEVPKGVVNWLELLSEK